MGRSVVAVLSVSSLVLALAACTGPAPAPETPAPSPPATEAPAEPVPAPDDAAAAIVISVMGVTVLGSDGNTIAEFGYFDPDAAPAIDVLTAAFGAEPEVTQVEAVTHFPASANSNWAGFELVDLDTETRYPDLPNFTVNVTAEQSGGVAIQTTDGAHIGMSTAEVAPLSYRNWIDTGTGTPIAFFLLEQSPVEGAFYPDYEPAALSVVVWGSSPDGVVERISAPGANWGS